MTIFINPFNSIDKLQVRRKGKAGPSTAFLIFRSLLNELCGNLSVWRRSLFWLSQKRYVSERLHVPS